MHIIILGAGKVGQYVAQSLSIDGHSIVLVDMNAERLDEAAQKMDVAIKRGTGTDWRLLSELIEEGPDLLLALTEDDEVNLVSCQIAKSFGSVRTICRIKDPRYLVHDKLDISRLFHIDHIVFPEMLVAEKIAKIVFNEGLYNESFFHGGAFLRTLEISSDWPYLGKTLAELHTMDRRLIIALIRRKKQGSDEIIFPHGNDVILEGDEITVIGDTSILPEMMRFFEAEVKIPGSCTVMGATAVGINLARFFNEKGIRVKLIDPSAERCYAIAETLHGVTVLHQQESDFEFMKTERVDAADIFIATTIHEEKNMLLGLMAKELGCAKSIAILSDEAVIKLAEKFGVSQVVSPRVATTDRILTLARAEKITSLISLYDQRAEVMELRISANSPLVGIPLSVLGPRLPRELLIAIISSRGRTLVVSGTHILSPQDEVIVVCHPMHRTYLEQIF